VSDDEYPIKNAPCCAYSEEEITENIAEICPHYNRVNELYYERQDCPEIPEQEDNDAKK
jgi:hypothetical protein